MSALVHRRHHAPPTASRPTCSPSPSRKGAAFGPGADVVDAALGGGLAAFLDEAGFEGKLGETLAVPTAGKLRAKAAILVGVGEPAELTRRRRAPRRGRGRAARRARPRRSRPRSRRAAPALDVADAAQAVAEGFVLGGTSTSSTRATPTPSKLEKVTRRRRRRRRGAAPRSTAARRSATRSIVGARHGEHAVEGEVAGRRWPPRRASCLRGTRRHRAGARRRSSSQAQRLGGVLGVGQGSEQTAALPEDDVRAAGRTRQAARARRQGRRVRLRRPVAQDRRRHGDDEDRHVGRRRGDRGDVDARATLGVKTRGHRLRPAGREHAERHRDPPGRRAEDPQRQDGRGAQHRRRGPADPRRRARRSRRRTSPTRSSTSPRSPARAWSRSATRSPASWATTTRWVDQVRAAADRAGEPVWPLPLPPEYRKQLESEVADLQEHRRQLRRRAHRRAVPAGVRRRRAVGAPRHRRARRARTPTTATSPKGGTGFGVRTLVELARTFERAGRDAARRRTATGEARGERSTRVDDARCGAVAWPSAASRSSWPRRSSSPRPRAARARRRRRSVTVHIRDNTFSPANLDVEAGHDGAVGQRRPQQPQRHPVDREAVRQREPEARASRTCARFADAGTFAYYCTLHGTPDERPARRRSASATPRAATPADAGRRRATRRHRVRGVGRTIRVPARREDDPGAVSTVRSPGDLVLVSPGVYQESGHGQRPTAS